MEKIRLNKYIASTGFCSRREADRLIEAGEVKVNGEDPELGVKVSDEDEVCINEKPLKESDETVYIAFNKPVGITCTTDTQIEDNIVDYINYPKRIFHIGRLDKPSEGLIFLTNDGDIVNKILRAENNHEKEYLVAVDKPITEEFIKKMSNGVEIMGTITKKCSVMKEQDHVFRIVLTQGLNRQIRKMCSKLGYHVSSLKRVRIMNVKLGKLKTGEWRYLTEKELIELMQRIKE